MKKIVFNGYNICVIDVKTKIKRFFREREEAEIFIESHNRPYDLICKHSKKLERLGL